jgi:sulfur carrier protein
MSNASTGFTVYVNDEPREVSRAATLLTVMQDLKLDDSKGVAVALNAAVLPKSQWQTQVLSQSDRILIIRATQGG